MDHNYALKIPQEDVQLSDGEDVIDGPVNFNVPQQASETYFTVPVCENQKNKAEFCPFIAIISVDINEYWLRSNIRHNHFPPIVDILVAHLRRSIGIAGTTTGRFSNSIRHIYNNEIFVVSINRRKIMRNDTIPYNNNIDARNLLLLLFPDVAVRVILSTLTLVVILFVLALVCSDATIDTKPEFTYKTVASQLIPPKSKVSSSVIDTIAGVILSPASFARTSTLPSSCKIEYEIIFTLEMAIDAVEFPTCIPNTIERDISKKVVQQIQ
ncbi:hypothetical protein AGLY_010357 [Aphis glycines]|uniref:Uncharacterized protein n=1 Tax=Aphis glycines TaxID=307491 RepID=A0A6G0TG60_APHGL|nr:hypothetical protein AGLY_010357 [Aphis glycines]